jgi:tetratricopeptide (TPR) repeat protein
MKHALIAALLIGSAVAARSLQLLNSQLSTLNSPTSAPAYERWGITQQFGDTLAERQLASAWKLLYQQQFAYAREAYRQIVTKFPTSAEAHLGLSMAYRYLRKSDSALAECGKALEFDSAAVAVLLNYADLIGKAGTLPAFAPKTGGVPVFPARFALSNAYYEKALTSPHPLAVYAHIGLWANYFRTGQLPKARQEIAELGRQNYFPEMLDDFAHNLLVALPPDAILFTNGDNDTHPLLCLQETQALRPDVSVVNLGLLGEPSTAALMRDSLRVPISLNDSQLRSLNPVYDSARRRGIPVETQLLANVIETARAHNRPAYFSVTVDPNRRGEYGDQLILEGLVCRIADAQTRDSADIVRIIENMTTKYLLATTSKQDTWTRNFSPLTRDISWLPINYLIPYNRMARHYETGKDKKKAIECYRKMVTIAESAGQKDAMKPALDRWLQLDPKSKEARAYSERYFPIPKR